MLVLLILLMLFGIAQLTHEVEVESCGCSGLNRNLNDFNEMESSNPETCTTKLFSETPIIEEMIFVEGGIFQMGTDDPKIFLVILFSIFVIEDPSPLFLSGR